MRNRKLIAAVGMTGALAGGGLLGATLGNPITSGAQDATEQTETEATAPEGRPGGPHGGFGRFGGFDLSVAADTLGLTQDELRTQLRDGKTLAAIAEEQGVDTQALIDALVAQAEARLDEAKDALPERIADLVENGVPARGDGEGRGPGGRGGFGGGPDVQVLTEVLDLTAEEIRTALRDGTTLSALAEQQGVEPQVVVDALVAEATERTAEAVESGRLTQEQADERLERLTERITAMVDEGFQRPEGGRGFGRGFGRGPAGDAESGTTEGD